LYSCVSVAQWSASGTGAASATLQDSSASAFTCVPARPSCSSATAPAATACSGSNHITRHLLFSDVPAALWTTLVMMMTPVATTPTEVITCGRDGLSHRLRLGTVAACSAACGGQACSEPGCDTTIPGACAWTWRWAIVHSYLEGSLPSCVHYRSGCSYTRSLDYPAIHFCTYQLHCQ
jgi:hypothetical protein